MRFISQGEAAIKGTWGFNLALEGLERDSSCREISGDKSFNLMPRKCVGVTRLSYPNFGSATPEQLCQSAYSNEPIAGGPRGAGPISPGSSAMTVKAGTADVKLPISGHPAACLGVTSVSYFT